VTESLLLGTQTYTGDYDGATTVGTYAITPTGYYSSQQGYDIAYVEGALTIMPIALTVTINDQSKTAGMPINLGTTAYTLTSGTLLGPDAFAGLLLTSDGAGAAARSGTYAITAHEAMGTGLGNYTIAYIDGTLTVTPSPSAGKSIISSFISNMTYNPAIRGVGSAGIACASCASEGITVMGGLGTPIPGEVEVNLNFGPDQIETREICEQSAGS